MLKVLLLGDSIRMHVQPFVAAELAGRAEVLGPEENCAHTGNYLERLADWLDGLVPDVIHFNAGLHDLKVMAGQSGPVTPIEQYRTNLARVVERLRELAPQARLIWATTTPIIEARYVGRADLFRREADVDRYNAVAAEVIASAGLEVDDLNAVVCQVGIERALKDDGTHMTDAGNRALAAAIARCVSSASR